MMEEPKRDWHQGGLVSQRLTKATRRKRRLHQWLCLAGLPEFAQQLRKLRQAMAADPDVSWAGIAIDA